MEEDTDFREDIRHKEDTQEHGGESCHRSGFAAGTGAGTEEGNEEEAGPRAQVQRA